MSKLRAPHHNALLPWNQGCCCHSVAQSCPTLYNPMVCSTWGFPVLHYVHWVSDAIQPPHPLLPPFPLALNLSQHQGLCQWVGSLHQAAKVLELQLQHLPFQWIFRIDSYRIEWFDLLALQETLKSLLQHHSLKASVLWCSAFFIVQHHNWKGPSLASPPVASMGYTLREGHWVMTKILRTASFKGILKENIMIPVHWPWRQRVLAQSSISTAALWPWKGTLTSLKHSLGVLCAYLSDCIWE